MFKLLTTALLISFSAGSFYAGQKYQTVAMLADGFISLAEHRAVVSKEVAAATLKTKTRTKAIARMKRVLVAVPIAGIGIAGYFEKKDFEEWQEDHPGGTFSEYTCEIGLISAEYVDKVLQGLPESLADKIPEGAMVKLVPECEVTST